MARLLYITIDGLRPDALEAAHLPTLLTLMQEGASTLCARSVFPSITLPCHMSIFHSLPPERHNVLTNTYTPMARPVPGLFEVLKQSGRRSGMFYSWEPLRDVARPLSLAVSKLTQVATYKILASRLKLWAKMKPQTLSTKPWRVVA
jgi:hypothetical protein